MDWNAMRNKHTIFGMALLLTAMHGPAWAAPAIEEQRRESIRVDSGVHDGTSDTRMAFVDVISSPGASWVRLHIADYHLGKKSYIVVRSLLDGDEQRLDARALVNWQNATAMFSGDTVQVELYVAPEDKSVFVRFDGLVAGLPTEGSTWEPGPRDLCGGTDNRSSSTDNRVGQITGCTAWFITNGLFLTAGHCVDTDRDANDDAAPNGTWDLTGTVSFNVPASTTNGVMSAAATADQFPIQTTGYRDFMFDAQNSVGEDWAVFEVGPNANGEMPWERYGTIGFRPTRENPSRNDNIRVTGFGIDNTPAGTGSTDGSGGCSGTAICCDLDGDGNCTCDCNSSHRTLQTATGPYHNEDEHSNNRINHDYEVDTMGANSGSPIIWAEKSSRLTIGIHTTGSCGDLSQANRGTSFEVNDLETAMHDYPIQGTFVLYVDQGHPYAASLGDGTIMRPFKTVTDAVDVVADGDVISIVSGSYPAADGNTFTAGADGTAFILDAPVGSVTIGD